MNYLSLAPAFRSGSECGINRLQRNRVIATRYGKLAVRLQATVRIAARSGWLRPGF